MGPILIVLLIISLPIWGPMVMFTLVAFMELIGTLCGIEYTSIGD